MEEVTEGTETTEGQAAEGTQGAETTEGAPGGSEGQPAAETTMQGTQEQTFFDPKQVPDDLLPAYKNMQRAFSKKMESLTADKQKIEAYDAFNADPVTSLQRYAKQYGYNLTRAEAEQQIQQQGEDWQPQSWDDVMSRATQVAEQNLMQKFGPVLQEVQAIKKTSIERELSEIDPTWQQYEGDMRRLMEMHPTLANDAALLYKMAVPEGVLESRATQAALAKLDAKGKSAQVSGGSTTTKQPKGGLPDKPVSFDDAVKAAKKKLAEDGIAPLGG